MLELVQLLGLGEDKKSVITGVEMFRKNLPTGQAGDNVGLLLRGIDKAEVASSHLIIRNRDGFGRNCLSLST